jgi:hypothetical protein
MAPYTPQPLIGQYRAGRRKGDLLAHIQMTFPVTMSNALSHLGPAARRRDQAACVLHPCDEDAAAARYGHSIRDVGERFARAFR